MSKTVKNFGKTSSEENKLYFFDNYNETPIIDSVKMEIISNLDTLLPRRFIGQGVESTKKIIEAKEVIARSINADFDEIFFIQDGAIANATIIRSVIDYHLKMGKKGEEIEVIAENIACPSIKATFSKLNKLGIKINYLEVDKKGNIDLEDLRRKINDNTVLLSVTHVNHILGTIQDIDSIIKIAKSINPEIKIHINAQWSYFKVPIDVKKSKIDFLTISAYKIHGPMISAIYANKNVKYDNLFFQYSFETIDKNFPNIAYIMGFKKAVEEKLNNGKWREDLEYVKSLSNYFWERISDEIEDIELLGPSLEENRDPCNLLVLFKRIEGESVYMDLSLENIIVSTTSACAHEALRANYVILAIGKKHEDSHGSIRFTFSKVNTKEEIDYLIEKLKKSVRRIREISAFTENYDYEKIKNKKN